MERRFVVIVSVKDRERRCDGMCRIIAVTILLVVVSTLLCVADEVTVPRVERDGNLMVPVRTVFEPFGVAVGWDAADRAVTLQAPAMNIALRLNARTATVNGARVALPVPAQDIGGQTFVPFSFAQRVLEGRITYAGDRIEMPTVQRTIMLRGTPAHLAPPPVVPGTAAPLTITRPTEGSKIGPRMEVYGTGPGGALLILETEVRRQADDSLLRVVPGIRRNIPATGTWHFAVAAPTLPPAMAEPLYYVLTTRYVLDGRESDTVSVRVERAE